MANLRTKLQAAIADLSRHGCDLVDPSLNEVIRADEARFYLGYLESLCGTTLTVEQVLAVARRMGRELRRRASTSHTAYRLPITGHVELN